MNKIKTTNTKIKQSDHILAVKIKTESNGLGVLKTFIVILLIAAQVALLILSNLYFLQLFKWFLTLSVILTLASAIHVLSSDYHAQAKATWVFFLLFCFGFGYVFYFFSDKRVLFARSRKKYNKVLSKTDNIQTQLDLDKIDTITDEEIITNCKYLYNSGKFVAHNNSKTQYFPSGVALFDNILEEIEKANQFIFIEFFIVSNGTLLNRFMRVLKEKVKQGVDVRIIYDDMGSHGTLKRKTKKNIINAGIKLECFNRLVPVLNIALNLRNHRKIVVIDGKVAYTGGANLADEYTNEKRMHGYWKDCGIKIVGPAVDNFSLAFLHQWEFLTNKEIDYKSYLNKAAPLSSDGIVVPFVSGPNYNFSIAQNIYANIISNSNKMLYIMSPYFIPDETIINLIINKARSGVDVRLFLPDIADKNFVYIVSRNNAEKLIKHGIKVYTMTNSFIHSKVILTENSAIVGSINMDLRSFNQQFESAVFTSEIQTLENIKKDFDFTLSYSKHITPNEMRRNKISYRILAGIFNIISPFM